MQAGQEVTLEEAGKIQGMRVMGKSRMVDLAPNSWRKPLKMLSRGMKYQACDLERSLERISWKGLSHNGEAGNGGGYFKCQGMKGER